MAAEFTTAVNRKTLEYVEISQFQNQPGIGLACGCSCPECGEKVGARIFVDSPRSSCFFHATEANNKNCNGGASETQLHQLAKKLFEQERELLLPHPEDNLKAAKYSYTKVSLERKIGLLRPDLLLTTTEGHQLIVEITVTHKTINAPEKMARLMSLGIPAIEISLDRSLLSRVILTHSEALGPVVFSHIYRKAIIEDTARKIWLIRPNQNLRIDPIKEDAQNVAGAKADDYSIWILFAIIVVCVFVVRSWLGKRRKGYAKRKRKGDGTN